MARFLQVFMIRVALSVCLVLKSTAAEFSPVTNLTYVCKQDGNMSITIPSTFSLTNIDQSPCPSSIEENELVLTNCTNKDQTIALEHKEIIGGRLPVFRLLCEDLKYTIKLTATELTLTNISSPTQIPTQKISHKGEITMIITNDQGSTINSAVIGETLSLVISAPENIKIDPVNCSAVSGNNAYPIWSASSSPQCSLEENVIKTNWNTSAKDSHIEYSIEMYAFRLVDSNSLTISCTVDVCPNGVGGCSQMCVTGINTVGSKKRRRRNAAIGNSEKVNRHLETNLRVYDSVEDKIQASGASVLTTSYVAVFCALVSTLYHSQL